ncbi:DUF3396 domain-containing protein [Corallococcus sp. CA053C]|uniref:type VI immunity family protein n=1 Tax=Corallococcus sp. CA053C TaxID=2316732 RepID=UPI000EA3C9B4|nr:type VI immunity family protein [Corallococcus sp. CA053C]RKH14977.1 DUF3396 domain-containing protein [Corallococcus sp. CA053C]
MSEHYPRIRRYSLYPEGRYLSIRECVSITFYLRRSHPELMQAVMHCLDVYQRAVEPQVLGMYVDEEGEWRDLDDKGWEFIRKELLHPGGANLHLSGASEELSAYEFAYRGRAPEDVEAGESSLLVVRLPTEFLEEHGPGRVRELALELAAGLPFDSGHAGLSFLYPEAVLGMSESICDDAFRYPGLDMPDSSVSLDIGTRLKGAYWLTFLGQRVLGELGGVAGLRARLHSPGTTVQAMGDERVVVTLGEWPEAGDGAQGRGLPVYCELARVLEPWLYVFPRRWHGFTREDMRRWERRFLD